MFGEVEFGDGHLDLGLRVQSLLALGLRAEGFGIIRLGKGLINYWKYLC